jgi:hypothetical protein
LKASLEVALSTVSTHYRSSLPPRVNPRAAERPAQCADAQSPKKSEE